MGTCSWHSSNYRMRSTMRSCFVRHVGASSNSFHNRNAEDQLGCPLTCLCMTSRKQRAIRCCDEDAPGNLSIGVSAQLRMDFTADRWLLLVQIISNAIHLIQECLDRNIHILNVILHPQHERFPGQSQQCFIYTLVDNDSMIVVFTIKYPITGPFSNYSGFYANVL